MKLRSKRSSVLTASLLFSFGITACFHGHTTPYLWNNTPPVLEPVPNNANGKTVLFDVSHGGVEGNADWVINGAFSDFADALQNKGYRVEEYRGIDRNGDGAIRYYDDLNVPSNAEKNEAIITYDAIRHADVFVLAETNRPFKQSEYRALEQFVAAGKGIFFIADHYNADRNLNTWDATEVFNGHNRSTLARFNFGGEYGDLRNPGADYGWLVEQFGVRFRFNGVDFKQGASGIEPPSKTEGLTSGVTPVLMAAGATLSIVDPARAKGLVYFSEQDAPTAWRHAVDQGLYYGGRAEGPYVAIAKSGAGKAAFIGDSSPIEDQTPLYRRQNNGRVKKTYPGWTDPGNAAQLSLNIIDWLATVESYTSFAIPGEITPNAKAPIEWDDPDNGQPWSQPSNGFNPWDTETYAKGSYGAPQGLGGVIQPPPSGDLLTVTQALAQPNGTDVALRGVVISELNTIYALVLGDEKNPSITVNIKLESSQRSEFSPRLNPDIVGRVIQVEGTRNDYLSAPGVRSVHTITDLSGSATPPVSDQPLSVVDALSAQEGELIVVTGKVVSEVNGVYGLLLQDLTNPSQAINIKLEKAFRATFNPLNNPAILGKTLVVSGKRGRYVGQAGVRNVTSITPMP